jgi:3,4-dihydroxy 2-butanone 4-phosphate synthase/GTP cyclohydrolase II
MEVMSDDQSRLRLAPVQVSDVRCRLMSAQPAMTGLVDRVGLAVATMRAGRPVLVCDAAAAEHQYSVVLSAALADPRWTAWTIRHTSGLLYAPLTGARADTLALPPMLADKGRPGATAHTVSVDAARGVTTGISARDRALTARLLADPETRPGDLVRPGHVLPLRARPGGVIERPRYTEAALDLCRIAGLPPVALIAALINDTGGLAGRKDAALLNAAHGVPVVDLAELVDHRLRFGDGERARVSRGATTRLPARHGEFDAVGYQDAITGAEHLALLGRGAAGRPLIAVHAECPLGDVFGGASCDCARYLADALELIARNGGVLIYLRRPGHRAVGGSEAHLWSVSDDGAAGAILSDLGYRTVRLLPGPTTPARLARPDLAVTVAADATPAAARYGEDLIARSA